MVGVWMYEDVGIWNRFEIALHKTLKKYLRSSSLSGFRVRDIGSAEALSASNHLLIPEKLQWIPLREVHKQPSRGPLQNNSSQNFGRFPRKHISVLIKLQAFNRLNFKGEICNRKSNNRKTDSRYWKNHLTTLTILVT